MKWILALALLVMSGCASLDKNYAAQLAAYQSANASMATVVASQVTALSKGMESTDPTARAVSAMALASLRVQVGEPPRPPEDAAYKWASLIVPTAGYLAMGYYNYRLGATQSNNARDVAMSTNSAFLGMGSAIQQAGVAGYPFIQAPGAVTTTNTTNTSTWTNSYNQTTSRNCNGGNGAGTTTGGAGGPATC